MSANGNIHTEAAEYLKSYAQAFKAKDPGGMEALMALGDSRFGLYEDVSPGLMNAEEVRNMLRHLPLLADPDMAFRDIVVYPLTKGLAFVTARQRVKVTTAEGRQTFISRCTVVLVDQGEGWKMLHGHFSPSPPPPPEDVTAAPPPEKPVE